MRTLRPARSITADRSPHRTLLRWKNDRLPASGALTSLLLLVAAGSSLAAPASSQAGPIPALRTLTPRVVVPGTAPSFRWPAVGEGSVAVAGTGIVGESPLQERVPIASVTKMMTALVILTDHPLVPGQSGPLVTIGPADVYDYTQNVAAGDSTVRVRSGEVLTEFQLLEGLMIPSGDNIADRLATWDAGSLSSFVAKMNAMARKLDLESTHYADPSGVDPRSASTAADQALVASTLIADPVIRAIVRLRRISLPVVGIITNRNLALRIDGIIGLKGGYSSHAHTCLVTAAFRSHHRAIVISVALGQPDPATAAQIDEALLETATRKLGRRLLTAPGAAVGTIDAHGNSQATELLAPAKPAAAIVWPGLQLTEEVTAGTENSADPPASARAGPTADVLTISAPWSILATVPLHRAAAPSAPPPAASTSTSPVAAGGRPAQLARQP